MKLNEEIKDDLQDVSEDNPFSMEEKVVKSPTPDFIDNLVTGEQHSVILTKNGKVYTAGSNQHEKLGHKDLTALDK